MIDKITLSDNDIISMDESTGDIIISIAKLPEYEERAHKDSIKVHYVEDADNIDHEYRIRDFNIDDATVTLDWVQQLSESVLTKVNAEETTLDQATVLVESPTIKFDDKDLMNPSEIDFQKVIQQATEEERQEAENIYRAKLEAQLKEKYMPVLEKLNKSVKEGRSAIETLDLIFDDIVPHTGPADSRGGELVRATMRILQRDYNDGDKFFESYGIETCGSSAEYLFDNGFEEDIQDILDRAAYLSEEDEKYSDAIMLVANHVIDAIREDNSLLWTINTDDSREYSTDYIEEHQPRYEFELQGSDDIVDLVENGVLTSWDLNSYVDHVLSYEHVYDGAKAARPWGHHDTSVIVEDLTRDGYDHLSDAFNHNPEEWWADLVSEHVDELTNNDYDDSYEDDGSYAQD